MGYKKFKISDETWANLKKIQNSLLKSEDQLITLPYIVERVTSEYLKAIEKNKTLKKPVNSISPKKIINASAKSGEKKERIQDSSLYIPPTPKKKPVKLKIDKHDLKLVSKKETKDTKFILIECQICGSKPIVMPVPKDLVKNNKEPVVDISFIHGNPQHVIVAQLDHDYQVRRRRASWVVFEKDYIS